jgi:hypothetical protein
MAVTINQYSCGITIKGYPKGFGGESGTCALLEEEQKEVIEWFWKHKPELFVQVMSEQEARLKRFMNNEAEKEQRWFLNWIKKNKPELFKEVYNS